MAKKIVFVAGDNGYNVAESVNEFIKYKNVIDIQYQPLYINASGIINDRVMVVYEEANNESSRT